MNRHFLQPSTRREMLRLCSGGFGYLALSALLGGEAAASPAPQGSPADPLAPRAPHFTPRARRVIFLFMHGGPSQVDTWDPKPLLTRDHGKPYPFEQPRVTFARHENLLRSPFEFRPHGQSGIPVSEIFPDTARHVDDLCVIRSLHGDNNAHGGALLQLHTGSDTFIRPSMGSWVVYGLGTENQNLPGFITLCPTLGHGGVQNWSSSFLPAIYQGTPIGNASIPAAQARISHISNPDLGPEDQRRQVDLVQQMNRDYLARAARDPQLEGRIEALELAFRMQTEAPRLLDISAESKATLALYGIGEAPTDHFGRQCLMARRLAEKGVRFIQCTHSYKWDQHSNLKAGHAKNAVEVDRPIAGLLTDLKSRGLLHDTLVLWGAEFGRTPTAQEGTQDGRDHNPNGYSMWLAGGGVRPGMAYGATDDYGYFAQQDKVHVHDLHATLLHLLGLDHTRLTYRYGGRDFRLTDVYGDVVTGILA